MAGRFLFQKVVPRMSRSTSLLRAQASAPVTRRSSVLFGEKGRCLDRMEFWEGGLITLTNFSHGPAAHPTTVVTNKPGIHGYFQGGGIRTLFNILSGAYGHPNVPVPNIGGMINGSPARYFSTLYCTHAIMGSMKPALVDYVKPRRIFSSSPSAKHWEHKLSAHEAVREAKWEAVRASYKADLAAWNAKKDAEAAAFSRFIAIIGSSWCFIFLSMLDSGSSHNGTSNCQGQSSSRSCSSCCKCLTGCSESDC